MKKRVVLMLGVLACSAALSADGYSEEDEHLIAGKDYPFPKSEGDLPEDDSQDSDENDQDDTKGSQENGDGDCQNNGQAQKRPNKNSTGQ